MPTVLRWSLYRAFFYSNEGREPAHVHVRVGDREVKVGLHDFSVAEKRGLSNTRNYVYLEKVARQSRGPDESVA